MNSYDVVVIGLGAFGSSSLYHLSNSKLKVLGVDQYAPPHTLGSSHGESRITRIATVEGSQYVNFAKRSHIIWQELEKLTSYKLFNQCGMLCVAQLNGLIRKGDRDFMSYILELAKRYQTNHQVLEAAELKKNYPEFRFHSGDLGYLEADAGYLYPENCISAFLNLAKSNGANITINTKVKSISIVDKELIKLNLDGEIIFTKKLLITAGAWIPKLIQTKKLNLNITRQPLFWFQIAKNTDYSKSPVSIFGVPDSDKIIYAFPELSTSSGSIKIAGELNEYTCDPDQLNRVLDPNEVQDYQNAFSTRYRINPNLIKSSICMYSRTPDRHFLIDSWEESANVIFCSACSGHGFKHSAAIGEDLAKIIMDQMNLSELQEFRTR